jgi:glutathione peroxidase-family protein
VISSKYILKNQEQREIASFAKWIMVLFLWWTRISVKGDGYMCGISVLTQAKNGLQDSDVEWNFQNTSQWKAEELEK